MDHEKQLAFLQNMTHLALTHAASTPNVPTPKGAMSHEKMMSFVSGMAKSGIQHLDAGGVALGGPTNNATPGQTQAPGWNSSIGNFLGTNNKFQAQGAPIQAGTNTAQLQNAYSGAQSAIDTQRGITGTLYNGINQGTASQNALTGMYTQQALGQGPNPALASLNQQTGQNIAQQAALAAGQRGAGANVGLIARQNAQQGAALQQGAVGQAATMQAQQQLASQQNLQNLAGNQISQGAGAAQGLNNAQQNEQNILQGANTSGNNANVSQQSNINNVNAGISTANQNSNNNTISGIGGALSQIPVIGSFFAKGGMVGQPEPMPWHKPKMMADGGILGEQTGAPQSFVGNWLSSNVDTQGPQIQATPSFNTQIESPYGKSKSGGGGGSSPKGENMLEGYDPQVGMNGANANGGASALAGGEGDSALGGLSSAIAFAYKGGLMKSGGKVKAGPGEKAVKVGDSLENDKVPTILSQGEVVIDRDTMKDPGPIGQMARALAQHIAKKNKGKKQ